MTTAILDLPAGLVPGAPDRTPEHVLIDDMKTCERMTCPDCGRRGLAFEPFSHNGRYVGYAACENCGHAKLLPSPEPAPPTPRRKECPPVEKAREIEQPAAVVMPPVEQPLAIVVDPPPDRLLQARDVAHLLSASIRTVWRLLERNELPQPIRYNRKMVRWNQSVIFEWIAAQRDRSQAKATPLNPLLCAREVANRLGIDVDEFRSLVERHEFALPAVRTINQQRWSETDVANHLAARRERTVPA